MSKAVMAPGAESGEQATAERRRLLARLAVQPGLCAACVHLRLLASPRSVFVQCGLAASDPAFPRYPALPVVRCAGFRPLPVPPAERDGPGAGAASGGGTGEAAAPPGKPRKLR